MLIFQLLTCYFGGLLYRTLLFSEKRERFQSLSRRREKDCLFEQVGETKLRAPSRPVIRAPPCILRIHRLFTSSTSCHFALLARKGDPRVLRVIDYSRDPATIHSFVHPRAHDQTIKLTCLRGSLFPRTNGQFLLDILASSPCMSVNRSSRHRSSRISPRSFAVSPDTSLIFLSSRCQCEIHEKRR